MSHGLNYLSSKNPTTWKVRSFAELRRIDNKPGFAWWVPHTLKKTNAIISAMKVRLRKTTLKYGIEIRTSVDHAMEIDRENGNAMWKDALALEMFNVGVAFEIFEDGQMATPPPTHGIGHPATSYGMSRLTLPDNQGGFWTDINTRSNRVHFCWSSFT